jgi:hypothetical protein
LVVLAFYTNDVADNTRATDEWERFRGASAGPRPFFTDDHGRLTEDDSFRDSPRFVNALALDSWGPQPARRSWMHRIMIESRVRQVIHHFNSAPLIHSLFHRDRSCATDPLPSGASSAENTQSESPSGAMAGGIAAGAADPFTIQASVLSAPHDPQWINAWRVTEALIDEIHSEAAAHGAAFLLAVVSNPLQVYPDAAFRARYFGGVDEFYQDRRLEQLGARRGFDVISLAEPMQQYADEHRVFLHGFAGGPRGWGHWNEAGHRLAGELIAAKICAMLARRSPLPDMQ